MSDLAETIAEWREQHAETVSVGAGSLRITTRALADLLDAAEAGAKARDDATCNDYLQVHRRVTDAIWESQTRCDDPEEHASAALAALKAAGVKFDLTTPDVDAARDAALEECKAALRTAYVEDEAGTLGMFDAIEIVDALRRTA